MQKRVNRISTDDYLQLSKACKFTNGGGGNGNVAGAYTEKKMKEVTQLRFIRCARKGKKDKAWQSS